MSFVPLSERQMRLTRRTLLQAGAAALIVGRADAGAVRREEITRTRGGRLQGIVVGGVAEYRGIAYAGSTAAAGRFLPPSAAPSWRGLRPALVSGAQCPQILRLQGTDPYPDWVDPAPMREDCLSLNLWAPRSASPRPRPVMVWLHGGGYVRGSGGVPIYDGRALALSGDVIVVTINHRLNIFGYAPLGVTVFGESGGGGKLSALLAMPAARGLLHKAIVQSGSALEAVGADEAAAAAARIYAHFGLKDGDVAALQQVPAAALYACYETLSAASPGQSAVRFGPVVDGQAIPSQSWTPTAPPGAHDIPMLIGTTSEETAGFIDKALEEPLDDDAALLIKIARWGGARASDSAKNAALLDVYRSAMPQLSRPQLLVRITTDLGMWRNAISQAERKHAAGGAPAYVYEFGWTTPCFGGAWALHALDVPFVFGNHDYERSWDLHDTKALRAAADPTSEYLHLGAQVMQIWTRFAHTGKPAIASLGEWPAYEPVRRATMLLARDSRLVDGMRNELRAAVMAM
ncbi:MAG: carboxylesterase family protein [Proteobacteria bacterium]|nr:carboxylesterase family protein [Pseudomonadota bacterium]